MTNRTKRVDYDFTGYTTIDMSRHTFEYSGKEKREKEKGGDCTDACVSVYNTGVKCCQIIFCFKLCASLGFCDAS